MTGAPFWSVPVSDLLRALDSTETGLSAAAAAQRLLQVGPNRLRDRPRARTPLLLLHQFTSPIVLLLVGAALLSWLVHDSSDARIILGIVPASGLLGFWQEYGAATTLDALLTLVGVIVITLLLPYVPLAAAFGFAPVPMGLVLLMLAIVCVYVTSAEIVKRWFYRRVSP